MIRPSDLAFRAVSDDELQKQIDDYTASVRNDHPTTSSRDESQPRSLETKPIHSDSPVQRRNISTENEDNWEKKFALRDDRYLTVSKFKSSYRIHIRDFYKDKTGRERPTKCGIALTLNEWQTLQLLTKDVNEVLKNKDIK